MEPQTIVALEIASSKVKGAIGAVAADGRVAVLAVEEIRGNNNVRYGRIQNIREVSTAVNEILRRLENTSGIYPARICKVAIGLGGRSLSALPAKAALRFPKEMEITENHLQRLKYEATRDFLGDRNIEEVIPRMYYVNNAADRRAVGIFGESLRGEFMMITCAKETRQNVDRLKIDDIDANSVAIIVRPTAVGDLVLSSDERKVGCALVDFGAETTTVSVYKDDSLAFMATIPMGSRLITTDLMAGLGITEEAAENYKLTLGSLSDKPNTENPTADEVNAYVRARAGEIAANILNQIERSGYGSESLAGIVLLGGGARLPEFGAMLSGQCKMPVRIATMPPDVTFRVPGRNNMDNIDIVSLLVAASRLPEFECLERTQLQVPAEEEEIENEVLVDEDEFEPEPQPQPQRRRPEREMPVEDDYDDDDDDLLEDDEDDEEDDSRRRGGIFGIGKNKKREKENRRQREDERRAAQSAQRRTREEEEYDEDEYDEEEEYNRQKDNTKSKINNLRNKFASIFNRDPFSDDE